MWITGKEFRKKYNISCQYFYLLKKQNKIKTKPYVGSQVLVWDENFKEETNQREICIYARVSTTKQKKDLENQIDFLKKYAISNGYNPKHIFSDIASGMNEDRPGLQKMVDLIVNKQISKVIISHKDRLTRFGFGYLESMFKKFDTEIDIINLEDDKSFQEELSEDLIAIIHHFSMKFYGKRRNISKKLEQNAILLETSEDK